jgi:hypothetical protein
LSGTTEQLAGKVSFASQSHLSGYKASFENKPAIAAVNRCTTQNQVQHRVFRKQ